MTVAAPVLYAPTKKLILQKGLNVGTDALAAVLVTSSYTPNALTDATWANVSANEVATGGNYTAGGVALGSMSSASYGLSSLSTIAAGGTAYAQTDVGKVVSLSGGTSTVAATVTIVEVNGGTGTGAVTAIAAKAGGGDTIGTPGAYTILPASPVSTTGGGTTGTGLTINAVWGPVFTAGNVSWASSTITAKYIVLVAGTAGSLVGTNPVVLYMDLSSGGGSVSTTNGTFAVNWTNGIVFVWG